MMVVCSGGRCVFQPDATAQNGLVFCMYEFPSVGGGFLQVDKPSILLQGLK